MFSAARRFFFCAKKDSETVKGIRYKIGVSEGPIDFLHTGGYDLTEIYIPSHGVIINAEYYVFKASQPRTVSTGFSEEDRYPNSRFEEIDIPRKLAIKLARIALEASKMDKDRNALKSNQELTMLLSETSIQSCDDVASISSISSRLNLI